MLLPLLKTTDNIFYVIHFARQIELEPVVFNNIIINIICMAQHHLPNGQLYGF